MIFLFKVMIYRFLKNICYKLNRLFGGVKLAIILNGNGVKHKKYRIIGTPFISVYGDGRIIFGDNFSMNNGLMANQIGFNTPCVFRAEFGSIIIGNNVGMSQTALIAKEADITIGDNVKLGGGVKIYTTDFHCLDYLKRRDPSVDLKERKCEPVTIGDDCFIGAGVFVLKGVNIGPRTIIGAGSVVTKDIPADCIAAGNPCRVIKQIERQ